MTRNVVVGAVLSVILWFPAAILVALLYRFPIPLGGYAHRVSNLALVPVAVVFYGIIGGFIPVAAAGALGGWWWTRQSRNNGASAIRRIWMASAAVAVLAAIFLAILEELIGPW